MKKSNKRILASIMAMLLAFSLIIGEPLSYFSLRVFAEETGTSNLEKYPYGEKYYYVKLPDSGRNVLSPYADVDGESTLITKFKIYDNGYLDDPKQNTDSSLTICAPEGWLIEVTGGASISKTSESLKIYDGEDMEGTLLLNKAGIDYKYEYQDIGTITSTSNKVTIQHITKDGQGNGIELWAKLVNPADKKSITIVQTTNGTVTADKLLTYEYDKVTLTATPEENCLISDIKVTDSNGTNVKVNGSWYLGKGTANFEMPGEAVTVTPTFTNDLSAKGGLYLNMPVTGTENITIPNGVKSFKVYDDGGKNANYNKDCDSSVVLTAPEGCIIELSGTITGQKSNAQYNNIYIALLSVSDTDGSMLLDKYYSTENGVTRDIPMLTSTGSTMTISFESLGTSPSAGLDLMAKIVDPNAPNDITVNDSENGTVVADKSAAKPNETVTLTATPDSGSILSEIIGVDEDNNKLSINGSTWYSYNNTDKATFNMPASKVTITPIFVSSPSAKSGLYVNMPITGNKTITIPEGVRSFKVYDSGGKDGNYNNNCNGVLTLTAPSGYKLVLKGTVTSEYYNSDFLSVYDGTVTTNVNGQLVGTTILDQVHSTADGEAISIGQVNGGQTITLHFYSNSTSTYSGLDLTVDVISPNAQFDVDVIEVEGGSASVNAEVQKPGETVTVNAVPKAGYILSDIIVTDIDGEKIPVSGGWYSNNQVTFTMPNSKAIITPKFVKNTEGEANLNTSIPTTGTNEVIIPEGITSFKVYDDGGANGSYSNACNGYLKLTAPEGYHFKITGSVETYRTDTRDHLTIYDGQTSSANTLLNACRNKNDISLTSTGTHVLLYFTSDNSQIAEGVDLKVQVIPETYLVAVPNANNLVYTGEEQELVIAGTVAAGGVMKYSLTGEEGSYQATIPTGINASAYKVYWIIENDEGEKVEACSAPIEVTIDKAEFKPEYIKDIFSDSFNPDYDGNDKSGYIVFEVVDGIVGYGEVTTKIYKDGVESSMINAGEYIVKFDVAEGDNYKAVTGITSDICKVTINKAKLTVTAKNYAVNIGEALPEILEIEVTGLQGNDTLENIGANVTIGYENGVVPSSSGIYNIVVSGKNLLQSYEITYANGELEIIAVSPTKVKNFINSSRTATTITLKWKKNISADGYVIQQYKSGKWVTVKNIYKNTTTSHQIKGLKAGTTYNFRIKAYKKDGSTKLYSAYTNKTVKTLPSKVKSFTYKSRTATTITLKWKKNTSADGYVIQQYKGGKWVTVKNIYKNTTTSHQIKGLKAGTTYKFRIKAYKKDGSARLYSAYTNKTVKTLPSNVAKFTYKTRTKTSITLKWAKNTSADGYVIQQYKGGKWVTIKNIYKNTTVSHQVKGLKKSTTYNFRIKAYKKEGRTKIYSSFSSVKAITVK